MYELAARIVNFATWRGRPLMHGGGNLDCLRIKPHQNPKRRLRDALPAHSKFGPQIKLLPAAEVAGTIRVIAPPAFAARCPKTDPN